MDLDDDALARGNHEHHRRRRSVLEMTGVAR
jgi:hypothetical protein